MKTIIVLWTTSFVLGFASPAAAAKSFACILEPNQIIDVSAATEGVAAEVLVDRGDRVKKGQILLRLNSDLEQVQRELAQTRVEFGERTIARNDELEGLLSDHEVDEMETDLQMAKVELLEAQTRIAMKSVTSPIDGYISERHRDPGEFVGADPVFQVVSIDPLYVEVIVPAIHLKKVSNGETADVQIEAPVSASFTATVIHTDPVVDSASGTFRVRLKLPNAKREVPSGLRCEVSFSGIGPA